MRIGMGTQMRGIKERTAAIHVCCWRDRVTSYKARALYAGPTSNRGRNACRPAAVRRSQCLDDVGVHLAKLRNPRIILVASRWRAGVTATRVARQHKSKIG